MKALALLLVVLASYSHAVSQSVVTMVTVEKTVKSPSFGLMTGVETRRAWGVGGFVQVENTHFVSEGVKLSDAFYGAYMQAPLVNCTKLLLSFTLKGGLVNEKFFVVTPSLDTRIKIKERLGVVLTTGYRHGYPSIGASLIVKPIAF